MFIFNFIFDSVGYIFQIFQSNMAVGRHLPLLIASNFHYITTRNAKFDLFSSVSDLLQFRLYILQIKKSNIQFKMADGRHLDFFN